ncbi:MAG TPA: hypothetical protein VJ397_03880, partial [Thermoplasmata archaeon]|nr:hypothetical protein [Thermoplasmata archaeon]
AGPAKAAPPPPPAARPAPPPPAPLPPAPAAVAATVECPACGTVNDAGTEACAVCGEPLPKPAGGNVDEKLQKIEEAYRSGRITKEQYEANRKKLGA